MWFWFLLFILYLIEWSLLKKKRKISENITIFCLSNRYSLGIYAWKSFDFDYRLTFWNKLNQYIFNLAICSPVEKRLTALAKLSNIITDYFLLSPIAPIVNWFSKYDISNHRKWLNDAWRWIHSEQDRPSLFVPGNTIISVSLFSYIYVRTYSNVNIHYEIIFWNEFPVLMIGGNYLHNSESTV